MCVLLGNYNGISSLLFHICTPNHQPRLTLTAGHDYIRFSIFINAKKPAFKHVKDKMRYQSARLQNR